MAAKKKTHPGEPETANEKNAAEESSPSGTAVSGREQGEKPPLDFDFFGDKAGGAGSGNVGGELSPEDAALAGQARTRRWMLETHQILGIATWVALAATVGIGQLNYNELYGGGGSNKWQTTHRALVVSTSALFAAAATFALLAPTPYKKPLRFDTGLVHRIAVIGATAGMLAEGVLGWITTHQADAGNPHNLRTMARTHQIVGYTTLGFLTIAGTVWVF